MKPGSHIVCALISRGKGTNTHTHPEERRPHDEGVRDCVMSCKAGILCIAVYIKKTKEEPSEKNIILPTL